VIGVLQLSSARPSAYTKRDLKLLERIGAQIAGAIANSQLYAQIRQAEETLIQQAKELTRSNAELEQFAYVASHDLQEPLRMVTSYVKILAQDYEDRLDADADRYINYAVDGANRMKVLINDLLAFSRVGSQGKPVEPTDCGRVMEQVTSDLEEAIKESRGKVTWESLPTVMADGTQLAQLLRNLVGNGIKFRGEAPPHVHVSAELASPGAGLSEAQGHTGGEWLFSVCDNGIGIAPKHHARIFQMFERLHHRSEYPGTGIGLAICQKIVERHGGRIWVESQPGKGSTFFFTIPLREEDDPGRWPSASRTL
jgi:light-regulated signal transduction histidine kinase (bacteriophytochrome)